MVTSTEDLLALAEESRVFREVLDQGDWYLVGSRSTGLADVVSDWDTIVLVSGDARLASPQPTLIDATFDDGLAEWAFTLSHAIPLRLTSDVGETYRRDLAARFASRIDELAALSYRAFRQSRNEAVSTLARDDMGTQALTAGSCVTHAVKFWLLAGRQPHPAEKWVLLELDRSSDGAATSATMRSILDMTTVADIRFDALWTLCESIDRRAQVAGLDPGSPRWESVQR